ncbi:ribosomal RNA-processing protein 7-domain-containing protein [Mucidula mucida]|nr:ribosomal RNA-processing protein 7-domain-containing protein [Mucidula mucida]
MSFSSSTVGGFNVHPIVYTSDVTHYLYARRHEGSKKAGVVQQWPNGRTLFLVNVPPDATERELSSLFKSAGTIERVVFDSDAPKQTDDDADTDSDSDSAMEDEEDAPEEVQEAEEPKSKRRRLDKTKQPKPPPVTPLPHHPLRKLRRTGQSAHIVFLDASSLDRALIAPSKPRSWPVDSTEPTGLSHYQNAHQSLRPPLDSVRAHADSSMDLYEFELAKAKQKAKYRKGEAIVDEDGFTLVTRGGAYGQTLGGGLPLQASVSNRPGDEHDGRRKRKEPKEKAEFYAFQKADKQRNALMQLKRAWENDKAKIEKLKASRKFKPY